MFSSKKEVNMWDDGEKKTPKNIIILSTKLKIKSTPSQFFFF